MNKHKKNASRLLQYAAASAGVLAINNADAQMVYTDIDPDIVLEFDGIDTYMLDLNNDGTDDFSIQAITTLSSFTTSSGVSSTTVYAVKIEPLGDNEIQITDTDSPFIAAPGNWIDGILSAYSTFTTEEAVTLDLHYIIPEYLALRLHVDGNEHYGWLRLYMTNTGEVILKDYAFENTPDTPIYTQIPEGPIGVTNIVLSDISDTHTAADLQISFEVPADESNIASYRIFAGTFSYNAVQAAEATSDYYTEVFPTGENQSVTLNADQLDLFGEVIQEFDLLYVSVYCVGFTDVYDNVQVKKLEPIVLGHDVEAPPVVIASVTPDEIPWTGITIAFECPANLEGIANFFSYIIPEADFPVMDTTALCSNINHRVLSSWDVPGDAFDPGETYTIAASSTDINSNTLVYGETYAACVQSHTVWDYYSGCQFEQMTCSSLFTLTEPVSIENTFADNLQVFVAPNGIQVISQQHPDLIRVYDISGRCIYQTQATENTTILPLPEIAGYYIIACTHQQETISRKVFLKE